MPLPMASVQAPQAQQQTPNVGPGLQSILMAMLQGGKPNSQIDATLPNLLSGMFPGRNDQGGPGSFSK